MLIFALSGGACGLTAGEHHVRLGISGGGSFMPDAQGNDLAGTAYPSRFGGKYQAGAWAAVDLHAALAMEAGFRSGQGKLHAEEGNLFPTGQSIDLTAQQFFLNAVYSSPYSAGGLRLFATGGIGFQRTHTASVSGSDIGFSSNFGGGLEARASRRFSVRVELRDFLGGIPRFVTSQSSDGHRHDIQASVGLVVHLR